MEVVDIIKYCLCNCGDQITSSDPRSKYKQGHFWRGKKRSPENLRNHVKSKRANGSYERMWTKERRELQSRLLTGKPKSESTRKKLSDSHKGVLFSEEHCKNLSLSWTPERKQELSLRKKKEHANGVFDNAFRKSSSQEYVVAPFLEKLGFNNTLEENYWVNGKDRRRKVPDFYNKETREIIELWGTYYHRDRILPEGERHETKEECIQWYAENNWKCRIVWVETEFKDFYSETLERIKNADL